MPTPSRSGDRTDKRDIRLELADRLIERIEAGTAAWQKPWQANEIQIPMNAVTGKPYRGVNTVNLLTFSPDPSDPRWCTYKQAQEQGWQVRKGEHGIPIEKWSPYERRHTEEELDRLRGQGVTDPEPVEKRMGVRYYTVFHASQIDGIPPLERAPQPGIEGETDERLGKLAENLGLEVRYGDGQAFYRPSEDRVFMPPVESFAHAAGHDTTLLHELSHATGHESRMGRQIRNSFGSPEYAVEELRAEMSAAMTAANLGIGFDPASQNVEEGRETGNSAAYLAVWLKALPEKERRQMLMTAIGDAQKISDYLIERTPELQVEQERGRPIVSRGDYVRYRNEAGQEMEGVVLDDAQPGEATRIRRIYRWPNGTPGMDGADHIAPTVLPDPLLEHIPGAVQPGPDLDAIDPITDAYKRTMGMDDSRTRAGRAVLMAVETARGQPKQAIALQAAAAPEPLTKVPDEVRPFLGGQQASVTGTLLRGSEEKGFFSDKMQELQEIIRQMPATYETDGVPDSERPVSLRYFGPNGAQWFIIEKDRGDPANEGNGFPNQTQAFGLADLGMGHPEVGYISIPEITRAGAELDYHFAPRTLLEVKLEHYPDLLPPEHRPVDLRKEQALQEYPPELTQTKAEPAAQIPPPHPDPAHAAQALEHSLEALKQHEITLPSKDGGSRTFNARQYLEDGLRRGFTVIEDPDGRFRWQGADGSRGRAFTDEKLTATFRAATAVDKDIGLAIRSAERQKADLEWER